ncbi:monocarboxylate transporter 9 isoform X2 [Plutella xylostella]|uniref:monocarboxylate transporter 9 isoform X2 n=1 Tax=Plutella xylostella TaxID=51655 RepID=UPI0020322A5B|nr:monocarboxylate transporter 9 isoform X2 [Plutella xylostella]
MAETSTAGGAGEKKDGVDEAEEKLLQENHALIVPAVNREDGVAVKASKKVKLPEEGGGGRFTIGPAPERDWEMVPPDGRWGWCILVGATLVNILIPGTIKSFGVLLVEFNDVFESSASASSGIVALCYFLYSSLGPLSSILSVRWSYRTVTLLGGSFAAFGMICSSWAESISYLYFSFGAMVGAGAGLAFPPTVYIVTSYFVRLRGLANGICMSGSAFGSIILPPVLRLLLESYGYKGAVLILGGIMLNTWAAALLFQPVEEHLVRKYKHTGDEEDQPQDDILLEENEDEPGESIAMEQQIPRINTSDKMNGDAETKPDKIPSSAQLNNSQNCIPTLSSQSQLRHNMSKRKLSYTRTVPKNTYSSASIAGKLGSQEGFGRKLSYAGPRRNFSTSSFNYVSTQFHGSTLSAFERPNEFASQFSLKSITDSVADVYYCCFCIKKKRKTEKSEPNKFFDVTLLKDPTYLVILLSSSTVAISCTNFIILLPSHAQNVGFDKARGALLLSTVSALDLVGRIGGSALCDLNFVPKPVYFVGGLIFSGITLVVLPFLSSYMAISVCCALFGLASGINNGVTTLVMAEILGVERLMSTYGISLFVNGLLQLVGPPICGLWFERNKNFVSMFVTFGFIFLGGASLWLFMPFINKWKRQKKEAEKNGVKAKV